MKTSPLFCLVLTACLYQASAEAHSTVRSFRADLDATFVQPQTDPDHPSSTATAVATFVLTQDTHNPALTTLSYDIQFTGLDVAPTDGLNLLDDITAIHLHDVTTCVNPALCGDGLGGQLAGATAGTRHVLNILGAPRADDADMQVFPVAERVTGLWDPSDANSLSPAPSTSIADPAILDLLLTGKLALMVHTNLVGSGEIGGALLPVPEPGTLGLALVALAGLAARKNRS
jgi:hypothetical protein